VIEHDGMPLEEQRQFWNTSDLPHSLRVCSGNKSIHTVIRTEESPSKEEWRRIASDLKLIFSRADGKVLTDCARLFRLPGGVRSGGTVQKIEYINTRIPLKTLTDWIFSQDVIKNKETKEYRDEEIKKNDFSSSFMDQTKVIASMTQAQEQYRKQHPARFKLYNQLVASRFKAEPGKRNEQLIGIVTFLYDAVSKEVAFEFCSLFYKTNALAFCDPLEQHMSEAKSHWERLETDYQSKLNPHEVAFYKAIPRQEKEFFRICRSLAYGNTNQEMVFNIPMTHFGQRLALDGTQISRMIDRFMMYGLLERVKKGTQTKQDSSGKMIKGKAGVYRWLG